MRHELFDELDAANPRWQREYSSVSVAAKALGLDELLFDFLQTAEGQDYLRKMAGVKDWQEHNKRARAQHAAELEMASRATRKG